MTTLTALNCLEFVVSFGCKPPLFNRQKHLERVKALASIQGLNFKLEEELKEKDVEIDQLKTRESALEDRLKLLEQKFSCVRPVNVLSAPNFAGALPIINFGWVIGNTFRTTALV